MTVPLLLDGHVARRRQRRDTAGTARANITSTGRRTTDVGVPSARRIRSGRSEPSAPQPRVMSDAARFVPLR
jgi:hypothetical protein